MFKQLRFQNFKSWQDTGNIKLSPITGFFGTNSSGKSAILQFLLMLKQTVESSDRQRVLHTGDEKTYVNLGTIYDIAYNHKIPSTIKFSLEWTLEKSIMILRRRTVNGSANLLFPTKKLRPFSTDVLYHINELKFSSEILLLKDDLFVDNFCYSFNGDNKDICFEFKYVGDEVKNIYQLETQGYKLDNPKISISNNENDFVPPFSPPLKNYIFPNEVQARFENADFLSEFALAYEGIFQQTYYLGPLREYPQRIYSWAGGTPQDVGNKGELVIPALLASRKLLDKVFHIRRFISIEEKIAYWLKELNLIDSFRVAEMGENLQYYQVKVKRTANSSEVLITDVGFGVSQILPVLVLCYYAPEGSTLILEQPEIHLHPAVQSGLADVLIEVMKTRNLQIILESHSEHLLRRLQRRIAEQKDGLTNEDISLYFCSLNSDGSSKLTTLELDQFGNIANWPDNFFGDEMGDLFAMTEAAMKRQMGES